MNLLEYLRGELPGLMKRRDRIALASIRDAIAAIENAEISHLASPATIGQTSEFVAGTVRFGSAERVVRPLTTTRMRTIADERVQSRLEEAARHRERGRVDAALTLKAEALALADRLEAYDRLRHQ